MYYVCLTYLGYCTTLTIYHATPYTLFTTNYTRHIYTHYRQDRSLLEESGEKGMLEDAGQMGGFGGMMSVQQQVGTL